MSKPSVMLAPEKTVGDQIELADMQGKIVAVFVKGREENKKTRFQLRSMTLVSVLVEGAKEPLEGVLFQAYFQTLKVGGIYVGRVDRKDAGNGNKAWILNTDGLDRKTLAPFLKAVDACKFEIQTNEPEVLA